MVPSAISNKLPGPAVIIDRSRVVDNVKSMFSRAEQASVRFRPHFKTHQSPAIGEWMREMGVGQITVSSWAMAHGFAAHGWRDITVALPWQPGASGALFELTAECRVGVLLDSQDALRQLLAELPRWPSSARDRLRIWIKLDAGYGRAGVAWTRPDLLIDMMRELSAAGLPAEGLLFHSGHSYDVSGQAAVAALHAECLSRVLPLAGELAPLCRGGKCRLSMGDTPTCSLLSDWGPVDEIRPGNFVFYDLSQVAIGACQPEQIAAAVLCPVLSVDLDQQRMLLHGGAVHLSKDRLVEGGQVHFGQLAARPFRGEWQLPDAQLRVVSLSQEHGIVHGPRELLREFKCGDLAQAFPVHSCLACDLHQEYWTLDGQQLDRVR